MRTLTPWPGLTRHMLLALLPALPMAALATPPLNVELTWVTLSAEPYTVSSGTLAGQGFMDLLIKAMHPRMSSLPPQEVHAIAPRIELEMHKPEGVRCTTGLLQTPAREQYLIFSQPYMKILPNGLITRKSQLPFLKPYLVNNHAIQLSKLLQDPSRRLGVSQSRVFGGSINSVLQPYLDNKAGNVVTVSGTTNLKMLRSGRIDYFLGYPFDQYDGVGVPSSVAGDTAFLPVVEGGSLLPAVISCQRTPLGQQMINVFNDNLADREWRRSLLAAYEFWLTPNAIASLRALEQKEADN